MAGASEFPRGLTLSDESDPSNPAATVTFPATAGVAWVVTNIYAQLVTVPWHFATQVSNTGANPPLAGITVAAASGVAHCVVELHARLMNWGSPPNITRQIEVTDFVLYSEVYNLLAGEGSSDDRDLSAGGGGAFLVPFVGTAVKVAFSANPVSGELQEIALGGFDTMSPAGLRVQWSPDGGTTLNPLGFLGQPGKEDYTYAGGLVGEPGAAVPVSFNFGTAPGQYQYLEAQAIPL